MEAGKWIGISAGRENKVTEKAVKTILKASGEDYDFYSLSSFEILSCDGCNGCVESHQCVKDDQLNQMSEAMQQAAGIVFGAPEYWDGMNAKGRAFWERICFSTRHNEYFPLADKPAVLIGISGDGNSAGVIEDGIEFMQDARLEIIEKIEIKGEYACFDCGYGHLCQVGGLKNFYDLPVKAEEIERPRLAEGQLEEEIDYAGIRAVCARFREVEAEVCR
ncbi:NADPH-dependent FMN reductase [Halanaerobium saccharolyticum]|uniref:NADPH-dependent FMN reductase n=1 Tax=Halanaerobium saccharolyticum TaxID=43595 RepID=A0A4R6LJD8_9FIRM|nr:flavodoxin family protein [Halanaerobium saccharolyticum]TDO83356.1 NADPH-dependent FMN reductase [Halanaerobium saccharolyticum]